MTRAKDFDEPLVTGPDCYQASDEAAYMACAQTELDKAIKNIEKAVCAASQAVQRCAGLKKLTEALDHLDIKKRYDLNAPALDPSPSIADVSTVFNFFGVTDNKTQRTLENAHFLTSAWAAHVQSYTPPAAGKRRSPRDVLKY